LCFCGFVCSAYDLQNKYDDHYDHYDHYDYDHYDCCSAAADDYHH